VNGPLSMLARGSLLLLSRRDIVLTCFLISASSASDWSSSTEAARGTPSRRVIWVDFTMVIGGGGGGGGVCFGGWCFGGRVADIELRTEVQPCNLQPH
jgi:hypothetical protein